MAVDSDQGYFHLLPTGWLRQDGVPYRDGRIKAWRYVMRQAEEWGNEDRLLYCVWAKPELARAERDRLRNCFGCPYGITRLWDWAISSPL